MTRIGIGFATKIHAITGFAAGFVLGVIYSVGGFFLDLATIGLNPGTAMAFGALIGMPVLFSAFGAAAGAVGAVFYNAAARRFGGVRLDVQTADAGR